MVNLNFQHTTELANNSYSKKETTLIRRACQVKFWKLIISFFFSEKRLEMQN